MCDMSMKRIISIFLLFSLLANAKADTSRITVFINRSDSIKNIDLGKGLEYALTAVDIAQQYGDSRQRFRALTQAGTVCFYGGLLNRSVDYLNRALQQAQESGDLLSIGNAYFNLGGVQSIMGDFARSRTLTEDGFQHVEKYYRQQKLPIPTSIKYSYLNNLGVILMKENRWDEAKSTLLEAIQLARKDSNQVNFSRSMVSLGELLLKSGQLDSSRQVLTEVVLHDQAYGIQSGLSVAHTFLGDLSRQQSNSIQALEHYRMALSVARAMKDDFVQERVTEDIAGIFQTTGRPDSALYYLNIHHTLSESSEKNKARQNLLQQDLELRLREQERSSLRQIRIERTILGLLAGISILLLFMFLFRYRKRSALERMEASLREEKLRLEKKLLQDALELKDKQLATQVMYSLQKNEMISELVTRIKETAAQAPDGQKGSLGKIIRDIESGSAEPWTEFEHRFQEVHAGFYERLMSKYPDLTPNERRLCAFLRLDMSTKEISNLTGQSVKAITQARFRLRSKLGIENPDSSLFEVLLQI